MEPAIDRIRLAARHSIGRAFLFTLLAVGATMSGLIGWPVMAFRTGAVLWMLAAAILWLRSIGAPRRPYRRTETWILLGRDHGLPESAAQAAFAAVLAATYRRFAELSALLALAFWIVAFVLAVVVG
ncbi:MAG: hypothetical protein JNK67_26705 [Alphaproteobacteria bacterium]|nr:hypothetical protein [Alphaproteobacteria bacterium]